MAAPAGLAGPMSCEPDDEWEWDEDEDDWDDDEDDPSWEWDE